MREELIICIGGHRRRALGSGHLALDTADAASLGLNRRTADGMQWLTAFQRRKQIEVLVRGRPSELRCTEQRSIKGGRVVYDQLKHYADKLAYEIDAADLKKALDTGDLVVVVDARSAEAFQAEHIPGAANIPHRAMMTETTGHVDRDALIVIYCDGIGCNASTKGAINMVRLGFHVKELIGGLEWWKRDGYKTHGVGGSERPGGCNCS